MGRVAFAALFVAGCLGPRAKVCDNGVICPEGLVCTGLDNPLCATQEELDVCKGKPDHTACSTAAVAIGSCGGQLCGECKPEWLECRYGEWKPMMSPTDKQLNAVWAIASNDVYAVGLEGTVLHYDGTAWSSFATLGAAALSGVWGSQELFISAETADVFHFTGTWQQSTLSRPMFGVWGAATNDVFAVGLIGATHHFDGSMWSTQSNGTATWYAVSGTSASNVYAAGAGVIAHWNGSWQPTTMAGDVFHGVWASGQDRAIAVGTDNMHGLIATQQATGWDRQTVDQIFQLSGVWGKAADDVYAVGDDGTIIHFDGASWSPMASGTQNQLRGIAGTADEVFAVGAGGTILRFSPR